jgi:hypothetical protein
MTVHVDFTCDRCGATASGRYEDNFAKPPEGWRELTFGHTDWDLCASCGEKARQMLSDLMKEAS